MTTHDVAFLSTLEHKLSEAERNLYEFRQIFRHYMDTKGTCSVEEIKEKPGEVGRADWNADPVEECDS